MLWNISCINLEFIDLGYEKGDVLFKPEFEVGF